MIVQIIGWFSIVASLTISTTICMRAWIEEDYTDQVSQVALFLIAAAICFSQPQTNYIYKNGCKNYIGVMMTDGKTATSVCAD